MVGGGTVLGSTIRTFYRLRFSIAHAIQDPYRALIPIAMGTLGISIAQGSLSRSFFSRLIYSLP